MSGYFEAMRLCHPLKIGETFGGKRIVETFWQWTPEKGDEPMFRLEGEAEPQKVSPATPSGAGPR